MKKRLLSFLLTGSLLLMLLPTAALAEDTAALSGGELLTKDNISTYVNDGLGNNTYVLSDDITVDSGSLKFSGTASLDLNGHTLTFTAPAETQIPFGSGGSSFVLHAGIVVSSGSMTLTDSSSGRSGVLDARGTENVGVLVTPNANFTMTGGTITNSTPDNNRGYGLAVFDATATMTGGKITGEKYGGVWTTDATTNGMLSSFTMSGSAVISDCGLGVDSSVYGGGVRIDAGTFTMEGGTITNCAAKKGGGVYFGGNTFTMSGGSITNCKAGNGGGVDIESSTFNLSGGTISGCESNRGGGVYVHNPICTFTMSSGSITDCSALAGGGVYMESDPASTFTMEGGSITYCKATGEGAGYGGGVLMSNGRFTMKGGEISDCTANEGSSIYLGNAVSVPPTFAWNYGKIEGSASLVYQLNGTTFRMEGLGTSADPYQIENGTQLLLFQSIVNGTNGQTPNPAACAELTKDIDMSSIASFAPIGTKTVPYTGTFNGNNHSISGLSVNGSDTAGLFGYVKGATIQNINLCDSQITATNAGGSGTSTGGIVGFATDKAKIENCSTNNITITANSLHVGGIIGRGENLTEISNCTNTSTFGGTYHVGGIAGSINGSSITNCGNSGNLPATKSSHVGGIVGFTHGGQISTCYNTGEVTGGSNADVGGIVGMSETLPLISDCYNVGAVHSGKFNGGIAGFAIGTYRYCYNTGTVTGGQYTGGVIGNNSSTTTEHCYYLDSAAPVGISQKPQSGVESRTAAEFADGSVLKSLIADRADDVHPWNRECQYLNATGKTQPVFLQQGDPHDHTDGSWLHDGTNHWKVCPDCNAVFDKAAHTAAADDGNCTTPVLCEVCGVTMTAANDAHTWGVWTTNSDGTHTRRCTTPGCTAGVETETCIDANHDYTCDLCGAALPRPAPTATPTATPAPTATAAPTATPAPTATAAPRSRTESAAVTPTAAPTSTPPQPTPRPTATAQPVIPATGDTDTPVLWTVLLFLSGTALLTLTANSKRRKR